MKSKTRNHTQIYGKKKKGRKFVANHHHYTQISKHVHYVISFLRLILIMEKLFFPPIVLYTWSSPPLQISNYEFIPNFKEPPNHLNSQSLICIGGEDHVYNTTRGMNNFSL